jgi:hypothetical protein
MRKFAAQESAKTKNSPPSSLSIRLRNEQINSPILDPIRILAVESHMSDEAQAGDERVGQAGAGVTSWEEKRARRRRQIAQVRSGERTEESVRLFTPEMVAEMQFIRRSEDY